MKIGRWTEGDTAKIVAVGASNYPIEYLKKESASRRSPTPTWSHSKKKATPKESSNLDLFQNVSEDRPRLPCSIQKAKSDIRKKRTRTMTR
jgi:hypothetical protein